MNLTQNLTLMEYLLDILNVWGENKIFQHYLCLYTFSCGETTLGEK